MKISDLERYLHQFRETFGDVDVGFNLKYNEGDDPTELELYKIHDGYNMVAGGCEAVCEVRLGLDSQQTELANLRARYEDTFEWIEENTPLIRYEWGGTSGQRGWVVEDTAVTKGASLLETIEKAMGD